MNNRLIIITLTFFGLLNTEIKAQCTKAEAYVAKVKAAENWTPTERVKSGSKVQGWTQLGTWYAYKCECDKGGRTPEQAENLKNGLNEIRQTIINLYSDAGEIPPVITQCKSGASSNSTNNSNSNKSSFQIEMENRFNNYNKAMSLKTQGENIAKAFAEQVKQFGNLNNASNPQELLNNFNQNMSQIAQLQAQNRVDNLNQIDATLGSALNDLNNGNGEGALFSTLSLIDQSYEQKQAKKEAEYQKQKLIVQQQQKMSQFYWKALELNNQAINNYLRIAAYSFSKSDEDFNIAYAGHHRCFGKYMKANYSYTNTFWTKNNCALPIKQTEVENNLIAKDIQYIIAAKRKFKWFEESGNEDFLDGAIRFAGAAATENPTADNYYLMGHYAGMDYPIVAYTSFETAKSLNPSYFLGTKAGEYFFVKTAIEAYFKEAIETNNLELIKKAIASQLHNEIKIEDHAAIIYAIKVDQPDVVQLFLNDLTNGKTQQQITTKVNEVILMASTLDAPKTIQRFIDLGFSVDFELNGKSPLEASDLATSVYSLPVLLANSEKQDEYTKQLVANNSLTYKFPLLIDEIDHFDEITSEKMKEKIIVHLFNQNNQSQFFNLLDGSKSCENILKKVFSTEFLKKQFFLSLAIEKNSYSYKYIEHDLVSFDNYQLNENDKSLFLQTVSEINDTHSIPLSASVTLDFYEMIPIDLENEGDPEFENYYKNHFDRAYNEFYGNILRTCLITKKYKTCSALIKSMEKQIDLNSLSFKNIHNNSEFPVFFDDDAPESFQNFSLIIDHINNINTIPEEISNEPITYIIQSKNIESYVQGKLLVENMITKGILEINGVKIKSSTGSILSYSKCKKYWLTQSFKQNDLNYWKAIFSGEYESRNK